MLGLGRTGVRELFAGLGSEAGAAISQYGGAAGRGITSGPLSMMAAGAGIGGAYGAMSNDTSVLGGARMGTGFGAGASYGGSLVRGVRAGDIGTAGFKRAAAAGSSAERKAFIKDTLFGFPSEQFMQGSRAQAASFRDLASSSASHYGLKLIGNRAYNKISGLSSSSQKWIGAQASRVKNRFA